MFKYCVVGEGGINCSDVMYSVDKCTDYEAVYVVISVFINFPNHHMPYGCVGGC